MISSHPSRRRRLRSFLVEALESRIAPASVVLTSGAGPFTLEVDPADSHLHITNGAGTEIFDQGQATGDNLTITGGGAADILQIVHSNAGIVSFSGGLTVNIAGSIHADGSVQAQGIISLSSGASITTGEAISGSMVLLKASSVSQGASLTGASVSISADSLTLSAAINAPGGIVSLAQLTNGRTIEIGNSGPTILGLTDAQLDFVNAGTLKLGDANTGALLISEVISPASYFNLSLEHAASIGATGGFEADITSAATYEKIINTKGLTINSGATLSLPTGPFTPAPADSFTIVSSTSAAGITGAFSGVAEAASVPVGTVAKTATYVGGSGHDLVLQAIATLSPVYSSGQLSISDLGGNADHITVSRDATNHLVIKSPDELFTNPGNGATLSNGGRTLTVAISSITSGLTFNLGEGADTLTLDFTGGNIFPTGNIVFDAGNPTGFSGDLLEIVGGSQGSVTHAYTNASSGTVIMSAYGRVDYTGVEAIHHGGGVSDFTFVLPGLTMNDALLGDDPAVGNGYSSLMESQSFFPTTVFQNPTGFVAISRGSVNDNVFVSDLPDFTAALKIGDFSGRFMTVTFTGAVSLASGNGISAYTSDTLREYSGAQLALHGSGVLNFDSQKDILLDASTSISTEDGGLNLLTSGGHAANFAGISVAGALSTNGSGSILLTGFGGNSGSGNHGIAVTGSLTTTGSGSIYLKGSGGAGSDANSGVVVSGGSIAAGVGGITIDGTPGGSAGATYGIDLGIAISSAGDVSFSADQGLHFGAGASVNAGSATVFFKTKTPGTAISLGVASQTAFSVSDAMLDAVTAGQVQISSAGSGAVTLDGDISSPNKLTIQTNGGFTGAANLSVANGQLLTIIAGSDVSLTGSVQATYLRVQAGTHNITLNGAGNDFSNVVIPAGGFVSLRDDTGFDLGAAQIDNQLFVRSDSLITQTGVLSGAGSLYKTGTGTLELTAANTYTGGTTLSDGQIHFNSGAALGSGTITLGDAGTGSHDLALLSFLELPGTNLANSIVVANVSTGLVTIGSASPSGTAPVYSGALTLNRPVILSSANPNGTFFKGSISGPVGTLTVTGGQLVHLEGKGLFTGDVQVLGTGTTLEIGANADVIPDASNVFLDVDTTLALAKAANASEAINNLTGSGTVTTSSPLPFNAQTLIIGANDGTFTFDGFIQQNSPSLSLTKAGLGTATLTGEHSYTGATTITSGTLALSNPDLANPISSSSSIYIQSAGTLDVTGLTNGTAPQTLVLVATQTLVGSGLVNGNLSGAGSIVPGTAAAAGKLTINGSFSPSGGIYFNVNGPYSTPGLDFDQIVVSGGLDLSQASLFFSGGTATPAAGLAIKLIAKTGAGGSSPGFNPSQGSVVTFGNAAFTAAYDGGNGGDFVLTTATGQVSLASTLASGKLTISDTDAAGRQNYLKIAITGSTLVITDLVERFASAPTGGQLSNGGHSLSLPLSLITKGVVLNGGGGDDTLTVDLTASPAALPKGGVTFNGGAESSAGDKLSIVGGAQGTVTYNYTNAHDGSIALGAFGQINYTDLEGTSNSGSASNLVFNLPGVRNTASLQDDGLSGNAVSRLSAETILSTDFVAPSGTVTINRGTAADSLAIESAPDLSGSLTIGSLAKPFDGISLNASLTLTGNLNLSAVNFTTEPGRDLSALGGTVNIGAGSINGQLSGGLGLTKAYAGDLNIRSSNTYTGDTVIKVGPLLLSAADAVQNSTVVVGSDFGLQFVDNVGTFIFGGLGGSGAVPLADVASASITLKVGNNNLASAYSGVLSGPGLLDKVGTGALTLTGANTHETTLIESGTLKINSDRALGHTGNELTFHGGTLYATATFTIARPIFLETVSGTFTAAAGKTLTLAGVIRGSGDLLIGTGGQVQVTNAANTNTGTVQLDSNASQMVNGVTVSVPGSHGTVFVTPGATPSSIAAIDLTATNTPVSLVIKSPTTGTVTVEKIISSDNTLIKKIALGAGVMLGDGVADAIPDLVVNGKLGSLQVADVNANTMIQLGKGLSYLDTYKNKPDITLHDILGPGVVIDVTGDGTTSAGIGGGGLGKIVVNSWSQPGLIKTTQSIASFVVNHGDSAVSIQVDPTHLGANTIGSIGKISIPAGQWAGAGLQVEGLVGQFLTAGVTDGSVISAGAFGKVAIKGTYEGTIKAILDPNVKTTVKGKTKIVATGDIASMTTVSGVVIPGNFSGTLAADGKIGAITIGGTFSGAIDATGTVGDVNIKGVGRFEGSLRGSSIGNVTAASFSGLAADAIVGTARQTIAAIGSIGTITARTGGLSDYIIAAGTDFGADGLAGYKDDHYTTYFTNAKAAKVAVSVGAITVQGTVTDTSIAAGVDPGSDHVYGDGNDVVTTAPAGFTGKTKLGALKFDQKSTPSLSFATTAAVTATNGFLAQVMTSLKFGLGANTATNPNFVKAFDPATPRFIDAGGDLTEVRLLQ